MHWLSIVQVYLLSGPSFFLYIHAVKKMKGWLWCEITHEITWIILKKRGFDTYLGVSDDVKIHYKW